MAMAADEGDRRATPGPAPPGASEVHLWTVSLTASPAAFAVFRSWLNEEETSRAERFAFAHLQRRYTISQGALRLLLAHYCRRDPRAVAFSRGAWGKPALSDNLDLRFNKSDSADLALFAFTQGCDVGVDLEHLRNVADAEQIASRYFSPQETAALLRESGESRKSDAFLRCWTRKEAYIKAVGGGLSMPLSEFEVTLSRAESPRIVRIGDNDSAGAGWILEHLDPADGFVGALAYPSPRRSLSFHGPFDGDSLLARIAPPA